MLSVANAISNAVTGSTHLFFSCGSPFGEPAESSRIFTQSDLLSVVHALKNIFAHYDEEECRREAAHQNASQSLHWRE